MPTFQNGDLTKRAFHVAPAKVDCKEIIWNCFTPVSAIPKVNLKGGRKKWFHFNKHVKSI